MLMFIYMDRKSFFRVNITHTLSRDICVLVMTLLFYHKVSSEARQIGKIICRLVGFLPQPIILLTISGSNEPHNAAE